MALGTQQMVEEIQVQRVEIGTVERLQFEFFKPQRLTPADQDELWMGMRFTVAGDYFWADEDPVEWSWKASLEEAVEKLRVEYEVGRQLVCNQIINSGIALSSDDDIFLRQSFLRYPPV